MTLCQHDNYTKIDWIKAPKYSTNQILLNKERVDGANEHLIIRFTDESPKNKYGWFYMSKNMVRRHKTQPNGRGEVYVVDLDKREEFTPNKQCEHLMKV